MNKRGMARKRDSQHKMSAKGGGEMGKRNTLLGGRAAFRILDGKRHLYGLVLGMNLKDQRCIQMPHD